MLFDDPLSAQFHEETQRIKEETMALLQRKIDQKKAREPKQRFYMSKELRTRLKELLSRQLSENIVSTICNKLLSLRMVPLDSINYLGLSNDDYSKISYLTPERYERAQGKTFIEKHVHARTKLVVDTFFNEVIYEKDGGQILRERARQILLFFSKDDLDKNSSKTIKLNRVKTYDFEASSVAGEPVYNYTYEFPKTDEKYYLSPHLGYSLNGGRLIDAMGNEVNDWFFIHLEEKQVDAVWDHTIRYHQSIHKILTKLFKDEYTERQKNIFAEHYFKLVIPTRKGLEFKIVDGDELKHYYLESNYKQPSNSSTLWQSCMRYVHTQEYLNFYSKIPGTRLAVLKEQGKVTARCLIWYANEKVYYDRIYYYNEEALAFMENYLESAGFICLRESHNAGVEARITVQIPLPLSDFMDVNVYPYLDSFRYYYYEEELLSNEFVREKPKYILENINGTYQGSPDDDEDEEDLYHCDECDSTSYHSDFVCEVGRGPRRGSYVCSDCGNYSDVYGETILADNSSYCDFSESYVLDDEMVQLVDGNYCYEEHNTLEEYENGYGYFLRDHHEYVEKDFRYYHPDDPELIEEQEELEEEAQEIQESQESQETNLI